MNSPSPSTDALISFSPTFPIQSTTSKTSEETVNRPRVLLIENDIHAQVINKYFLTCLSCQVNLATNGTQVLSLLEQAYDLVILDVSLPDISGIEVCQQLRRSITTNNTPIIILTTMDSDLEDDCLSAGANEFNLKPMSLSSLYQSLCRWLPHFQPQLEKAWKQIEH